MFNQLIAQRNQLEASYGHLTAICTQRGYFFGTVMTKAWKCVEVLKELLLHLHSPNSDASDAPNHSFALPNHLFRFQTLQGDIVPTTKTKKNGWCQGVEL